MKILNNNTSVLIGTWVDPGDYPSGAGAGSLPSYSYVEGIDGELVVQITHAERLAFLIHSNREEFNEWLNNTIDLPSFDGILSCVWQGSLNRRGISRAGIKDNYILTLKVVEIEVDPNWCSKPLQAKPGGACF